MNSSSLIFLIAGLLENTLGAICLVIPATHDTLWQSKRLTPEYPIPKMWEDDRRYILLGLLANIVGNTLLVVSVILS